jgi:hypothetical protein
LIGTDQITNLLQLPESATLDFKREFYDFSKSSDHADASLVKDVCSMINTIRTQTAFIIFGIDAQPGSSKSVLGLTSVIDDAIIQDKVKEKILPRVEFSYYSVQLNNLLVGVMEFPVRRYESPVAPTVNMRGVKLGTIYYRHGSTNTEAHGQEVIRIYEWLKSVPAQHTRSEMHDELLTVLTLLQHSGQQLSPIISRILAIGKKYRLPEIIEFASGEIKGIGAGQLGNDNAFKYRLQKVFIDFGAQIHVNNVGFRTGQIKDAMRKEKHFIESDLHMGHTVHEMETLVSDMAANSDMRFGVLNGTSKAMMPWYKGDDTPVRVYLFPDDLANTVRRIRQRAIDLVMTAID